MCYAADWHNQNLDNLTKKSPMLNDGEYGDQTLGKHPTIFLGGIAHELGHAFALPHCGERWDEKTLGPSLMGEGNQAPIGVVAGPDSPPIDKALGGRTVPSQHKSAPTDVGGYEFLRHPQGVRAYSAHAMSTFPPMNPAQTLRLAVLCLLMAGLIGCHTPPSTPALPSSNPWGTIVAGVTSEPERLALVDLQRYIAQVTGEVPALITPAAWQKQARPALIVGTPQSNPILASLALNRHALGAQGYCLVNETVASQRVIVAAGEQPEGAVNAVYGLLREAGFGFFLGSETQPGQLPAELPVSPVVRKPAFTVRGVLPWYNFFNSPTTWEPMDHRAFADQLIRMGANFVGFHTYDYEPFAAYAENGVMKWGERLRNTREPNWGTHPVPATAFPYGTDKLFAEDYFGAASTQHGTDTNAAIRLEQNRLRDALDYAHKRGLRTCLGFEINSDPTIAAHREIFLQRINHLLDQYPTLDYLWIWQPETQGAQGFARTYHQHPLRDAFNPEGSTLEPYAQARRKAFDRVVERTAGERPFFQETATGKAARAREGARLEQFAQLALRALGQRRNAPKLVISGWGGDERLLSAEYYDGLDKLLPKEVVFSSLDHIWPRPRVDKVYGALPPDRQRWPIPWLELDGDQWQPQPFVHVYEQMARDAQQGGSQGLLGIHWRTRDIEENLGFLVDYAWQPGLTAKQYFDQYAARCYPAAIAPQMANIHDQLDRLGYRWVNGGGQPECGGFSWGPGSAEQAQALQKLHDRASDLLPLAGPSRARLQWLLDEMDWVLLFRTAEVKAVEAGGRLQQNKPAEALALLDSTALADALHAFARRLSTRGEYGVLATIEIKAVYAWNDLRQQCLAALGKPNTPAPVPAWNPTPQIILPRFLGSVSEGATLELNPISLGGKPIWLHYRALGKRRWTTEPLQPLRGWVQQARVPPAALVCPGLELGFSFAASPRQPMAFGPIALTVTPASPVNQAPLARVAEPLPTALNLSAAPDALGAIELHWNLTPQADYFRVYRDDKLLGDTALPFFPDAAAAPAPRHRYAVEAWHQGAKLLREETEAAVADIPLREKFAPAVSVRGDQLLLTWPASNSRQVAAFDIRLESAGASPITARIPSSGDVPNQYTAALSPGEWRAQVTPINRAGKPGAGSAVAFQWPPIIKQRTVELPLDQLPPAARLQPQVDFSPAGAAFKGGYLELPHQPWMDLAANCALSFEFQMEEAGDMPVLLCHGAWQIDGWFVQILGGRLVIRTPQAEATGPVVQTGKWYKVRWELSDRQHRLLVNGEEVQPFAPLQTQPTERTLRLGQYDQIEPRYRFRGTLRNIRVESREPQVILKP